MTHTDKKQGRVDIHIDRYDSVMEFAHAIADAPRTEIFVKNLMMASRTGGADFTMTQSWEEAQGLLLNGYPEGLKAILKAEGTVKGDCSPKRYDDNSYMGYRPNVQRYLQGLPTSMVRRYDEVKRSQEITIMYDNSACYSVPQEVLARAGKNLMTLVQYLEARKCKVNLYVFSGSSSYVDCRVNICIIKIKDARQRLNPLLISYPTTHPSFFRRHIFRWIETNPYCATKDFVDGYGHSIRNFVAFGSKLPKNMPIQDWLRSVGLMDNHCFYLDCEEVAKAPTLQYIIDMLHYTDYVIDGNNLKF